MPQDISRTANLCAASIVYVCICYRNKPGLYCGEVVTTGKRGLARTSGTFRKGDPRAKAAGQKSRRKINYDIMEQIKARVPAALEALDTALANGSDAAIKMVLDRIAPLDLIRDEEVKQLVTALEASNAELTAEVERLREENEKLKAGCADEAVNADAGNAGKRPPDNRAN